MAAKTRELRLLLGGDAKSVQRAFMTASKAAADFESKAGRSHALSQRRAKEAVSANALLTGSFKSMARQAVLAGAGFATAYVGIAKAKDAVKSTEELAHATLGLHKNLGLSIKSASEWAAVARVRNVDTKALNMSFGTLAKNVQAATDGGKKQAEAFKALGVSQEALKSGDFNRILGQVSDGLGKMRGGTEKTALSMRLFGRGWQTIVPVLRGGSKAMQDQLKLADKYGVTFGGKSLKSVEDLIKAQRELKFAQLGLQIAFTEKLAPALLKVERAGARVVQIFRDPNLTSDQKWRKISGLLQGLGGKLEQAFKDAFPRIVDAAAAAAPKAAKTFVQAWLNAGIWGKLFTLALISKKIGLFGSLGGLAVGAFRKRYVPQMAKAGAAGGVAAAGAEGAAGSVPMGKFRAAGRLAGAAFGVALTAEIIAHAKSIPDAISGLLLPVSPGGSSGGVKPQKKDAQGNVIVPHDTFRNIPGSRGNTIQPPTNHPHGRAGSVGRTSRVSARASGGGAVAHAAGGSLSHQQLMQLWVNAGGDAGLADTMAAIAQAESGGNPGAHNTRGEDSRGLWQINVGPGANTDFASWNLFSPSVNARAAVAILARQGLHAWTTYTSGAYRRFVGGKGVAGGGGVAGQVMGGGGGGGGSSRRPSPVAPRFPSRLRTEIRAFEHGVSWHAGRIEDDDRLVSQAERMGNYRGASFILSSKLTDEKWMRNAAKGAIRGYKAELKILRHQLRTVPKGRRSKIVQKIKDILAKVADLRATVKQLGFDIEDTKLDIKDENDQAAEQDTQNVEDAQSKAFGDYQQAISDVDLQVAAGLLTPEQGQAAKNAIFARALGGGFGQLSPRDVWQVMADQRQSTDDNTQAVSDNTQAVQDLKDEVKRQNDFAQSVTSIEGAAIAKSLADFFNGEIGAITYARSLTPGNGSVVRYRAIKASDHEIRLRNHEAVPDLW